MFASVEIEFISGMRDFVFIITGVNRVLISGKGSTSDNITMYVPCFCNRNSDVYFGLDCRLSFSGVRDLCVTCKMI